MKKVLALTIVTAGLLCACNPAVNSALEPDLSVSVAGGTFFVDEPVVFHFSGAADIVSFWSGEAGNDFRWKDDDRVYEGYGQVSFGSAFMNGAQWNDQAAPASEDKILSFWWSNDFSGTYTPEAVAAATWHDATPLFTFASARVSDARVLADATPSGKVPMSNLIPDGTDYPVYFAFRYHLRPIVEATTDSRSRAVVSSFTIECINDALHIKESVVTNTSAGWSFVNIGYNDDDADYMPEVSASYIYFNASTANTAERTSWAISKPYTADYSVNQGCDYAVGVKSFSDTQPASYTHSYASAGEYDAVFECRNVSADGTVRTTELHVPVKIVERGTIVIDNPDDPIKFSIAAPTRAAFSDDLSTLSWTDGEKLGIYASNSTGNVGLNYPYSVHIGAASATIAAESSQWQYSYSQSTGCTFYAYAPFTGSPGEGNRFVVPISVPSLQEQSAPGSVEHLSRYAVLKSYPATMENDAVSLHFRNLTSVVKFTVKASSSISHKVSKAVLKSASPLSFDRGNLVVEAEPTSDGTAFQINDPVDSVMLSLRESFALGTSGKDLLFTVIPGAHATGSMSLQLITEDGWYCDVPISGAVNFAGNGVYEKTVTVNPSDFRKMDGVASWKWVPVSAAASIAEGEYMLSFRYDYDSVKGQYLLPATPVARNPIPVTLGDAGLVPDSDGNLNDAPSGYIWTLTPVSGGWKVGYKDAGTEYVLSGCDSAQGVAVSTDGKGDVSGKTYSSVWTFSDDTDGYGMQMNVSVSTRHLTPWYVTDHFEWRMTGASSKVGGFVLYKKTEIE